MPEPSLAKGEHEDCSQHIKNIAEKLNIIIEDDDIERWHRFGKPRTDGTSRPIICRFGSYVKKRALIKEKKKLRVSDEEMATLTIEEKKEKLSKTVFLCEDLTPFRKHIFRYIRNQNNEHKMFDVVSSHYGQICCKVKNQNT